MAHMVKRILAGICMDEEAMAYEVIKGVDYGGTFLDTEHTATVFRQELFFPKLFRRQSIDQWKERGSKSMLEIAHERVVQILDKAGPAPLPDGADQMLEQALKSSLSEAEKISADM
jgi:trimethylamine:corrinoid methyltransferase-like protein